MSATPARVSARAAACWAALVALAAAVSLQKIRSFDYWWHLRTGQLIADSGAVPVADPYTWTVPGAPWLDSHWLYQLVLHGIHRLGGHDSVVLAKLVLVLAALALLAVAIGRRGHPGVVTLSLGWMLLLLYERIMPRPELASFVLLAALLAVLERDRRRGDAWLFAVVPLQVVWANVHGLWVVGAAVCALYAFGELLRPPPGAAGDRSARLRRLALVALLAGAAGFVNANGLAGARYPLHFLGMLQPGAERDPLGALIRELSPLIGGRHPLPLLARAGILGLAAASAAAMALNHRRLPAADPLVWAAFFGLALAANRNAALFAVVAAPILARNAVDLCQRRGALRRRGAAAAFAWVAALLLLAAGVDVLRGGPLGRLRENAAPGLGVVEDILPLGAADWLARERPAGPLANHQVDGGYLIWRLYPDQPVMLDGRLEVFGAARLIDLSFRTPADFRRLDARHRFGAVLLHHAWVPTDELLWWLYRHPRWRLAFVDDAAAVFVRRAAGAAGDGLDVDVEAPGVFPPLSGPPGAADYRRRRARANLLYALHRYAAALELWEQTLARYPDAPDAGVLHGRFLYGAGHVAAGDAVFDALLAARPSDAPLLASVADLRLAAGRRREARDLYDRALAADPALERALAARARLAEAEGDAATAASLYRRLAEVVPPADPAHREIERKLRSLR